jgi:two-component system LytT family response regulator
MRLVIADDEPLARARLFHLCRDISGLEIVSQVDSGTQAINAIRMQRPDVVILDAGLEDVSGMDVLRCLDPALTPLAILLTSDPAQVRDAEADDVHYLTRPVDGRRLAGTLMRVRSRLSRIRTGTGLESLRQIVGEVAGRHHLIDVEAIDYLESVGSHVVVNVDVQRYVARGTLKHFAKILAPLRFVRIERSVLINLGKVAFAQRLERGAFAFTLRCGRRMISSSKYRKDILDEIRRAQPADAVGGR